MADTDTEPYIKISSTKSNPKQLFSQFIFKSAIVTLFFLVILPLFSSQAPDFIHQSFNTRSWELLQLVLVGIAVSYGLFSQKTEDSGKEHSSTQTTFDNAHSYVSKFLEVSSVFDDETENPSGSDHNKIESWNSQYFREQPMVVVAQDQESSVLDQERRPIKPILLPVRSLNSRVPNSNIPSRSSSLKNLTRISDENVENVVLRSPIPWRSRSGIDPHPPLIDESKIGRYKSHHDITEESPSHREKIYYKAAAPPPPPPPPTKFHSFSELKSATQKKPNTESVSKVRSFVPVSEKKENPILVEDKRSILNQRAMVSSSDDDEEEDEEDEERRSNGDVDEEEVGPDVNKQADEFIAKFREQIRLQRIDEIKRSTKRNSNK